MADRHWPFFDLRITTPRLELRYPDDDLVTALADLAAQGIHDPATMPFSTPWTRQPAGVLERESLKAYWRRRVDLSPAEWHLPFAVLEDGELVGVQELFAINFAVRRTVESGSWVGRAFQRRGIGAEMRAAVLHLAFAHLDADVAETGAFHDNPSSIAVTRKLGYEDNGLAVHDREGTATTMLRFRLPRDRWTRRDDITVAGLDACLPLLGLATGAAS
jgi:RimJ/RimL family protein N-acetyltransferase